MRKEKIGGRKNLWTIMYADDKVLLAKNEQKLKEDGDYQGRFLEKDVRGADEKYSTIRVKVLGMTK